MSEPRDIDLRETTASTAADEGLDDEASLAELVGKLTHDASELLSAQVQLAVAEIKEEAARAGRAAGVMGGSGALAYLTVTLLSVAAALGLDQAIEELWLSFLLVAVIVGAAAAALFSWGRAELKRTDPVPRETLQTLEEDRAWLRQQVS
jgi:uncharacterized membrane protein YqjE